MRADIFWHAVQSSRRALLGWALGIGAFIAVNVAVYPAVKDQTEYDDILQDMPDALLAAFGIEKGLSLTSPAGYLISQVFGFLLPLLFVVFAVALGSRSLATEEETGTLDLLLAHPVSRRRVALEKFAALGIALLVLGFVSWAVLVATAIPVGLHAGSVDLAIATLASVLLGIQAGSLALATAAAIGRRTPAAAVAVTVSMAGFVLESLGELVEGVARVRWLSPFHFANGNIPMLHGLRALDVVVLVVLALAACAAGVAAFERRDLGV